MHRLFKHLGVGRGLLRIERYSGEACDKHNLEVRLKERGALGDFNPVGARHDDISQEQIVRALIERQDRAVAIGAAHDIVTGALQSTRQKAADGVLIFGKENFFHWISHVSPQTPAYHIRLGAYVTIFAG